MMTTMHWDASQDCWVLRITKTENDKRRMPHFVEIPMTGKQRKALSAVLAHEQQPPALGPSPLDSQ